MTACTGWWISGQGMGRRSPYFPCSFFYRQALINTPSFYKPTGLEESILEGKSHDSRTAVLCYPPFHPLPEFECPLPPPPKNSSYSLLPQNQMLSKPAWLLFKPFSERSLSGRPSAVSTQWFFPFYSCPLPCVAAALCGPGQRPVVNNRNLWPTFACQRYIGGWPRTHA